MTPQNAVAALVRLADFFSSFAPMQNNPGAKADMAALRDAAIDWSAFTTPAAPAQTAGSTSTAPAPTGAGTGA